MRACSAREMMESFQPLVRWEIMHSLPLPGHCYRISWSMRSAALFSCKTVRDETNQSIACLYKLDFIDSKRCALNSARVAPCSQFFCYEEGICALPRVLHLPNIISLRMCVNGLFINAGSYRRYVSVPPNDQSKPQSVECEYLNVSR